LRIVVPAYPPFNIYTCIASQTTALGPVCVATVVNKMEKWDVEVIDENNLGRFGPRHESGGADHEALQRQRPADVVGLYGGLTSSIPRLYEIAKFYKAKGIVTVAGGQHFGDDSTIEEALSSGVDYVVVGEAEKTIKELLEALQGERDISQVKGIAFLDKGKPVFTGTKEPLTDFDVFALPDFSLVRYARIKIYPVERIRGCGMDCEFCTVKGKPRHARPERLLQHISDLVETRNARNFFVVDDLFGQQRQETLRFCNMLAEYQSRMGIRLRITVQIRLDKARDTELLRAMRYAGVRTVAIGFESPIEQELRAMNKHISAADMVSLAKTFRRFGFWVHGMFIFGYPLKDNADFRMSAKQRIKCYRRFIRQARIDTLQILLPVPLPGTGLRKRLEKQNRIYPLEDVGWEYYDGTFPLFEPDEPMQAEQMHHAARAIMGRFYQFKYMFLVPIQIVSFPAIVFFLHNIRSGWERWHRRWRNYLIRSGGWIVLRRWTVALKQSSFSQKMQKARVRLRGESKS